MSISPGGQGPSTTTSQQTLNERVVLPSEIMNLPNMTFLLNPTASAFREAIASGLASDYKKSFSIGMEDASLLAARFFTFPEYHVTPIRLEIVALLDKNAPYMAREDIRLTVEASGPEENKMPEREQEEAEKNEDEKFLI